MLIINVELTISVCFTNMPYLLWIIGNMDVMTANNNLALRIFISENISETFLLAET